MSENKKYYWLKLKRDFFKRHDITIIEALPNGDKYLLFYMKLLVESIDHEGSLRFSDTVPYNDAMLSAITHTDIDIVRSAVKVFEQFGMMDMFDDGTLFLKQVETMIGDETDWAEKKRAYREKQKLVETTEGQERTLSDKRLELDKEIEKDIKEEKKAKKPEKHKYGSFQNVFLTDAEKDRLIEEFHSLADISIQYLSDYKVEKEYSTKDDNLTIRRWVIDAVRKKEGLPPIVKPANAPTSKPCKCGGIIVNGVCKTCGTMYDGMGVQL